MRKKQATKNYWDIRPCYMRKFLDIITVYINSIIEGSYESRTHSPAHGSRCHFLQNPVRQVFPVPLFSHMGFVVNEQKAFI